MAIYKEKEKCSTKLVKDMLVLLLRIKEKDKELTSSQMVESGVGSGKTIYKMALDAI